MRELTGQKAVMNPRIVIEGLGPFEKVDLEIKPITVFVGKNSVGKSLLLTTIWYFAQLTPDFPKLDELTSKKVDELLEQLVAQLREQRNLDPQVLSSVVKHSFVQMLRVLMEYLPESLKSEINRTFERAFGTIPHYIARSGKLRITTIGFGGGTMDLIFEKGGFEMQYSDIPSALKYPEQLSVDLDRETNLLQLYYNGEKVVSIPINAGVYEFFNALIYLLHIIVQLHFGFWHITGRWSAIYNVDGRSGIIRTLLRPWILPVLGDLKTIKQDGEFIYLVFMVSEKLNEGAIDVASLSSFLREIGVKEVTPKFESGATVLYVKLWNGKEFRLDALPSGIRESLIPALSIFLDHVLLVLIEEPEAHLHPIAITEFTKLMAKAVNAAKARGRPKYIIISTHSDYLLAKLSNLIVASSLSEDALKEMGLSKEETISPDDLAVYLVRADWEKGTSEVVPLEVSKEGIAEEEFAKVVEELAKERTMIDLAKG